MAKAALPARYVVDRQGTPDPEASEYYVLDVVHDTHAREILGRLARTYVQYGQPTAAQELTELLQATKEAHANVIRTRFEAKNPKTASAAKAGRSRRR